jgi:hydrogenase/urease accessory protein HupE
MNRWALGIPALFVIQIGVLLAMGRPLICECGTIRFWENSPLSPETSQQLFDWYTFSHIVHGFLFYGAIRLAFRRMTVWPALLIAMGIEIAWEILENTPWVIEAYRQQALAQGYVGDSTINSVLDTVSMMAGFAVARKIPVWASILLVLLLEFSAAYAIRDNLTLNVLNFIHPIDAITRWQSGLQ